MKFGTALIFGLLFPSAAFAQTQNECIDKLDAAAIKTGLLQNYKLEGRKAVLFVNESMWNKLYVDVKEGFAETVNCAIAGPGMAIVIDFRGSKSGKTLANWDGLHLSFD